MKTRISDLPYSGPLNDDDALVVFRGDEGERSAARSNVSDVAEKAREGTVSDTGDTMTGALNITDEDLDQTSTLEANALSFDSPGHIYNLTAYPGEDEAASRRFVDGLTSGCYDGVDLTEKFASEIAAAPYSGDAWAWIKARITAGNFTGIRVCDYIPFTAGGKTFNAQVAGINTYKEWGDTAVGNHIDFISRELIGDTHGFNPVDWNNGLIPVETVTADGATTSFVLTKQMHSIDKIEQSGAELTGWTYNVGTYTITFEAAPAAGTLTVTGVGSRHPWLASDLYLWLNSLAGSVPNSTDNPPSTAVKHVDYTNGGVYGTLPQALKNVIVEKRMYLVSRYSDSAKVSSDSAGAWVNIGKLWIPSEFEVCGASVWGGTGYTIGAFQQYPIFANSNRRVKANSGSSSRNYWWTLTASASSATYICNIDRSGFANRGVAKTNLSAPICFRVAKDAPVTVSGEKEGDNE